MSKQGAKREGKSGIPVTAILGQSVSVSALGHLCAICVLFVCHLCAICVPFVCYLCAVCCVLLHGILVNAICYRCLMYTAATKRGRSWCRGQGQGQGKCKEELDNLTMGKGRKPGRGTGGAELGVRGVDKGVLGCDWIPTFIRPIVLRLRCSCSDLPLEFWSET